MIRFRLPRLLGQAAVSVFDQAWLSALNLMLGLLLIRLASKDTYGIYAQLFAAGLFSSSVLEALVLNPLVNLVSGRSASAQAAIVGHMARYQGRLGSVIAVALGVVCAWVSAMAGTPHPWLLGLVFAGFVKANAAREFARSTAFLAFRPAQVLRIDMLYGAGVVAGVAVVALGGLWRVDAIFAVLALANLLSLVAAERVAPVASAQAADYRESVRQAWQRGRLGLPGTVLAWIVNYSYLYLAAAWLGVAVSADLNASRLLLVPISLSVVAWARVARPRIGALVAQGEPHRLDRLLLGSLLALVVLTAMYVAVLWLGLPWLQVHVLGSKYDHAGPLLLLWGVYFAVNAARWVGTAALMGQDRYGFMLVESIASFVALFVALGVAVPLYGVRGVIMALIAVECLSLAMTWGIYWRFRRA